MYVLCRTKLDSKKAGCEEDVTLRLAEMIYCSQKFDNELSHERGIGKVFDTIFERQANIQASPFFVSHLIGSLNQQVPRLVDFNL